MCAHMVKTQEDWSRVTADDTISFDDAVIVTGDIDATNARAVSLSITIEDGAHMVAPSSADNWHTIHYGHLTLLWDGTDSGAIQVASSDEDGALVTLAGYPDDVEPYVSAASTSEARFERTGQLDHTERPATHEAADSSSHYTWLGDALARRGAPISSADLQSCGILDALFPDNPHLWDAGKCLRRFGRKGDSSHRIVDLRKARTYLDRAIAREERLGDE